MLPTITYSAKILGVFSVPSFSHQQIFLRIGKELSLRGHEVTLITSHPMRDNTLKNLTEIDIGHITKFLENKRFDKILSNENSLWSIMNELRDTFDILAEAIFETKEVHDLINSNKKFDLVMAESHDPVFFCFGPKFSAPVIGK